MKGLPEPNVTLYQQQNPANLCWSQATKSSDNWLPQDFTGALSQLKAPLERSVRLWGLLVPRTSFNLGWWHPMIPLANPRVLNAFHFTNKNTLLISLVLTNITSRHRFRYGELAAYHGFAFELLTPHQYLSNVTLCSVYPLPGHFKC